VRPSGGGVVLVDPRTGAENGLLVGPDEVAQLAETFLEDGLDSAPVVRPHVQQHVPVAADRPGQLEEQLRQRQDVLGLYFIFFEILLKILREKIFFINLIFFILLFPFLKKN
jgi:hypothetical protein